MFKKSILPLLVLGLLFSACEKEQDFPNNAQTIVQQEVLKYAQEQNMLFLYEETSNRNLDKSGWFITKAGVLETYSSKGISPFLIPSGSNSNARQMDQLLSLGEATDVLIDEIELYEKFKLFKKNDVSLNEEELQADQDIVKSYYGIIYKAEYANNEGNGCSMGSSNNHQAESFDLVLLEKSGAENQMSKTYGHRSVVNWLKDLAINAGL